jgi:hypothetical protein
VCPKCAQPVPLLAGAPLRYPPCGVLDRSARQKHPGRNDPNDRRGSVAFATVATIPLRSLIGDLDPAKCKLHCAVFNGEVHPLDVLARSSDEWMTWSRWRPATDAFNREFIFSLAQDRDRGTHWLFGGIFEVVKRRPKPHAHSYDLKLREDLMGPFIKRLTVAFRVPGRQRRLNMDTYLDHIEVVSIREHPYAGEAFPGHDKINHTFGT